MNVRFSLEDAQLASDEWGFNCGPSALCAALNKTPEEIRGSLLEFEEKRYTNPTLMKNILNGLGVDWHEKFRQSGAVNRDAVRTPSWPNNGLVRIQWDGPWCNPEVPVRARYRQTHWVASRRKATTSWREESTPMPRPNWPGLEVFDVNAMCVGGWISYSEWADELVPWLLRQVCLKNNGFWWVTHAWEVEI